MLYAIIDVSAKVFAPSEFGTEDPQTRLSSRLSLNLAVRNTLYGRRNQRVIHRGIEETKYRHGYFRPPAMRRLENSRGERLLNRHQTRTRYSSLGLGHLVYIN